MSNLTPTESERLRVWSAGVMGYQISDFDIHGDRLLLDAAGQLLMMWQGWNPLVSLDQAIMVAGKVTKQWSYGYNSAYESPYAATVEDYMREANSPGEALVIACADAAGEKWRDGEEAT